VFSVGILYSTTKQELNMTNTINDLTIYELAGEDFDVWMTQNKRFGFDLELEREDGTIYEEKGLNPHAAEALADFCKRYLHIYERVTKVAA
jgi:hypothetical protein